MRCSNCGSELKDGAKFCMACGTRAEDMAAGASEAAARGGEPADGAAGESDGFAAQMRSDRKRSRRRLSPLMILVLVLALVAGTALAAVLVSQQAGGEGSGSPAAEAPQGAGADAQQGGGAGAVVDKSRLVAAIADAKKIEQGDKTKAAKEALDEAIAAAEKVAEDDKATQKDVDAAVTALEDAVRAFKASKTGTEALNEALDEAYGSDSAAPAEPEQATGESQSYDEPAYDGGGYTEPAAGGDSGNAGGSAASQPAQSAPEKHWVEEQGHYETVVVSDAWDEPIYEFHNVCSTCGMDFVETGVNPVKHASQCGGFVTGRDVQVGSVHHDAVTEQQWVVDVPGHWE